LFISHIDPHIEWFESNVQKINHLQSLLNQLSAANAPIEMDAHAGPLISGSN
jgi:UDP-3-O-acyl-N-acetylglucosamine deacetylase